MGEPGERRRRSGTGSMKDEGEKFRNMGTIIRRDTHAVYVGIE